MKYIFKTLVAGYLIFGLWSCKKDEHKVILEGGSAPVLTSSVTDSVPMSFATQNNTAFKLNWTNPDYQFNTGVSSLDVSYNILIDTTSDFSNPNLKTVSVGSDLSKTFTQAEFNDILLNQLQLNAGVSHQVNIKVEAFLGTKAALLSSNVLSIKATPYAIPPKVQLPVNGELYLIGNATPGGDATGWDNPVPVPSQQFTQVTPTLYEITIPLIGGKQYLAIPVNGDWSHKYAVKNNPDPSGGDFGYDWSDNFPGPATSGTYKITLDFQRGKFTVTPQ
ncbi:MAG: SusE domain-containing protein [Ginsengibacter sp.]